MRSVLGLREGFDGRLFVAAVLEESCITSTITSAMSTMVIIYHFIARVFGLRIASAQFLMERHRTSIAFVKRIGAPRRIMVLPQFKEKCPRSVSVLEHVVEHSSGKWRFVETPPASKDKSFVCIGCFDPSKCEEGHTSWVQFVNSLTLLNVQQCTDGIQRRGIVASVK